VRKVCSGFEYFLLVLDSASVMTLRVVGMDVEFDSLSNGTTLKAIMGQKVGILPEILGFRENPIGISCL
jgi:hypothetical protein